MEDPNHRTRGDPSTTTNRMGTEHRTMSLEQRRLTYALHLGRDLDDAFAALPAHLSSGPVVEALGAFLLSPRSTHRFAMRAVELLADLDHPAAHRALGGALTHRLMKVRRASAMAITPARAPWELVVERLRVETAQLVRVQLVALLSKAPEPTRWEVAVAIDDPHWRVRKQVIAALDSWGAPPQALRDQLAGEIDRRGLDGDRARGVLAYLELSADSARSVDECAPDSHGGDLAPDLSLRPWWHVEPSLMRANLAALTRDEAYDEQAWLVWLLVHPEERVRALARKLVIPELEPDGLVSFLLCACEPRQPAIDRTLPELLARLGGDTIEAAAWRVLELASSDAPWSSEVGLEADLAVDPSPAVRWATSWLHERIPDPDELASSPHWISTLESLESSASPEDRACAQAILGVESEVTGPPRDGTHTLTLADAEQLLADPERATSWVELERAAERRGARLDRAVPREWTRPPEPAQAARVAAEPLEDPPDEAPDDAGQWWERRRLGPTGLEVSRMGITGHYNLPESGFAEALERGINLYFWEPIYVSQTRSFAPLSPQAKSDLVVCAGTFEATAKGLRKDVEGALRAMKLERLGVFFVFWVRDRERLSDELLREMDRLRAEGLVDTFGVSTHSRELARGFIEEWPVVMVRHNAAHRGAEREVLPHVDPSRAGVITFSNLCYGRMISELPDLSLIHI